ncbi:MAG TPA: cobalamin biosynthesis protein P47K [Eggerthellaceae bacterium]|nr:cobalamin biosynthesis protein P47K [Eggerthellaceae bacterium]
MGKPNVIILSGFLGSGKTTVLVRMIERLREREGADYRIAIVENEIGSASVDSSIIQEAGYSVTEMLSGCVCCTLIGQLVPALHKLEEELDPHLIILEATGVATPDSMANNIRKYGGYPTRIVTLVDASRWQRIKLALQILLTAQVEPADIVCVNKVDLADEATLAEVDADIRAMNPDVPIVHMAASTPVDAGLLDEVLGGAQ